VPQRPTLHQWDGLALLCPTHGKAPETEGGVLSAEQLGAGAPATLRYDLKLWTGTLHEGATYPPA
jgi:hypothetical protein